MMLSLENAVTAMHFREQLQKVDKLERSELLTHSNENKEATDTGQLVLTYLSLLSNVHKIVYKHLHVLYQSG